MFVFSFGHGYYELQHAVVMAETVEEAQGKLFADIERQLPNRARWPDGEPDCNWVGENGFDPEWFNRERFDEAIEAATKKYDDEYRKLLPREVTGDVTYVIGVDG